MRACNWIGATRRPQTAVRSLQFSRSPSPVCGPARHSLEGHALPVATPIHRHPRTSQELKEAPREAKQRRVCLSSASGACEWPSVRPQCFGPGQTGAPNLAGWWRPAPNRHIKTIEIHVWPPRDRPLVACHSPLASCLLGTRLLPSWHSPLATCHLPLGAPSLR